MLKNALVLSLVKPRRSRARYDHAEPWRTQRAKLRVGSAGSIVFKAGSPAVDRPAAQMSVHLSLKYFEFSIAILPLASIAYFDNLSLLIWKFVYSPHTTTRPSMLGRSTVKLKLQDIRVQ